MMTNVSENDREKTVKAIEEQTKSAKAYEKLNRTSLDIDIPRQLSEVEMTERMIDAIKKSKTPDAEKATELKDAEEQLKNLKDDVIRATLVPLRAKDIILIQSFVAEANDEAADSSLGLTARLFMMVKAEQCGTVWVATREREILNKKYFSRQEEVALLDDRTLNEICRLYKQYYVLSEEERKNLQGAARS